MNVLLGFILYFTRLMFTLTNYSINVDIFTIITAFDVPKTKIRSTSEPLGCIVYLFLLIHHGKQCKQFSTS